MGRNFNLNATDRPGKEVMNMAKNTNRGFRQGIVKDRSQFQNPNTGLFQKRGPDGRIMDVKTSGGKFKGVGTET